MQPAQRGVRLEVVRVELADQVLERLDRLAGRAELVLEERRAEGRGLARVLAILGQPELRERRDLRAEHVGEFAPLRGAAVQADECVERAPVARRQLEQPAPRGDRARPIAQADVEHQRVPLELAGAQRGLGGARRGQRLAAVLALEDLGELGPPLVALVQRHQRGESVRIGGRRAQRLLPAIEGGELVAAGDREAGEALEELGALAGRAGGGHVVLERLLEARVAGLLEHALDPLEGVAVARDQLEHGGGRVDHAVDVGEPGLEQHGQPAQHRQALGAPGHRPLARGIGRLAGAVHRGAHAALLELELAAQRAREPGIVTLALVQLHQRLECGIVVGGVGEHLLVEVDGAARIDLPLAVGLRHLLEDAEAGDRIAGHGELVLEAGDQLLPHLRARGQAAMRLGDLGAGRLDRGDPVPRVERAVDVSEPELGELRDLLEPADQLVGGGATLARVVERELVEVDQAAPVPTLAEVVDVAGEGLLVHGIDAERLVQQLRRAIAIAHVLARDGGELEDLADQQNGRGRRVLAERVDLGLHQPGHRLPVLVLAQQLAQLARGLAAGLLVRDEVGQHFDQRGPVRHLRAVQRGAAAQHLGALGRLGQDGAAVAQRAIELRPLRALRQRLLERVRAALGERIHADGAAQVVDAGRVVAGVQALAPELDEQLAGLVPPRLELRAIAEPRARVHLGELLGDLERARRQARGLLEVGRGGLEVRAAQGEHAELVAELRAAARGRGGAAEHVELGLVELRHHRVVAE